MGTRARINIFKGNQILVSIYRQMDGYPDGLGTEVAEFAASLSLVNGLGFEKRPVANGMGCFAAQLIKHLKDGPGSIHIRSTGPESHGEEYVYNLKDDNGHIHMAVLSGRMTAFGLPGDSETEMETLYSGPVSAFKAEGLAA